MGISDLGTKRRGPLSSAADGITLMAAEGAPPAGRLIGMRRVRRVWFEGLNDESFGPLLWPTEDGWNADDELRVVEERCRGISDSVDYFDVVLPPTPDDPRWMIV